MVKKINLSPAIFLSHVLSPSSPSYGDRERLQIDQVRSLCCGDSSNSQRWHFHNHLGTHIDAPLHFIQEGAALDQIEAKEWIFQNPVLLDLAAGEGQLIAPSEKWENLPPETDLILIRTGFERFRGETVYWQKNPGLAPELGPFLKAKYPRLRALGMDFISASSFLHREAGALAHKAFLSKPAILLIEDMSLVNLEQSPLWVVVSPLRVEGTDGAPVTVIAQT